MMIRDTRKLIITKNKLDRYSFNGKENESISVQGAYDFGARILDSRLGRWMSVDPLTALNYFESPYCYAGNSPTVMIDPDGKDAIVTISQNTITIKSKIFISGESATDKLAKTMQDGIMSYWGKNFTYVDPETKKEYTVKFDVEVINSNTIKLDDPALLEFADPLMWDGDENFVEISDNPNHRSFVHGTGASGVWGAFSKALTFAHEYGHLLGCDDGYIDIKRSETSQQINPQKVNNDCFGVTLASTPVDDIMGGGEKMKAGQKIGVTQWTIDGIASHALGISKNKQGSFKMPAYGMPINKQKTTDLMPYLGNGHYELCDGDVQK